MYIIYILFLNVEVIDQILPHWNPQIHMGLYVLVELCSFQTCRESDLIFQMSRDRTHTAENSVHSRMLSTAVEPSLFASRWVNEEVYN